nr:unnamed protein product [Digitaria exilis]
MRGLPACRPPLRWIVRPSPPSPPLFGCCRRASSLVTDAEAADWPASLRRETEEE